MEESATTNQTRLPDFPNHASRLTSIASPPFQAKISFKMQLLSKKLVLLASCLLPSLANAGGAPTDSYRDADEMQSSYLDNHNMDPNIVGSAAFGMLWSKQYLPGEEFYAKPLIFTSSKGLNGNKPVVILNSNFNNIYIEDAKAGGSNPTLRKRGLAFAFTQADADNCPDLGGPCGIIGTPVIEPNTEIMYLFSKSYADITGGTQGTINGKYRFHAIDLNSPTLEDLPGYPIMLDGARADNDPSIHFLGGPAMQRPALLWKNGIVYGAFGSVSTIFPDIFSFALCHFALPVS